MWNKNVLIIFLLSVFLVSSASAGIFYEEVNKLPTFPFTGDQACVIKGGNCLGVEERYNGQWNPSNYYRCNRIVFSTQFPLRAKCDEVTCVPSCEGKECGSDFCEGQCGFCGPSKTKVSGSTCFYNAQTTCGSDFQCVYRNRDDNRPRDYQQEGSRCVRKNVECGISGWSARTGSSETNEAFCKRINSCEKEVNECDTVIDCGQYSHCQTQVAEPSCTNECSTSGTLRCDGSLRVQICKSNHDSDPCLEWGFYGVCGSGKECMDGKNPICQTVITDRDPPRITSSKYENEVIRVTTNEDSRCKYSSQNQDYDVMGQNLIPRTLEGINHQRTRRLSPGSTIYVRCADYPAGNKMTSSARIDVPAALAQCKNVNEECSSGDSLCRSDTWCDSETNKVCSKGSHWVGGACEASSGCGDECQWTPNQDEFWQNTDRCTKVIGGKTYACCSVLYGIETTDWCEIKPI